MSLQVRYTCGEGTKDLIVSIKVRRAQVWVRQEWVQVALLRRWRKTLLSLTLQEPATCKYIMVVRTPRLCKHAKFGVAEVPVGHILCRPVGASQIDPKDEVNLGRKSRCLFLLQGMCAEAVGMCMQAQPKLMLDEADEAAVSGSTASAEDSETVEMEADPGDAAGPQELEHHEPMASDSDSSQPETVNPELVREAGGQSRHDAADSQPVVQHPAALEEQTEADRTSEHDEL